MHARVAALTALDSYRKQMTVDDEEAILNIYDTAGQEDFSCAAPPHLPSAPSPPLPARPIPAHPRRCPRLFACCLPALRFGLASPFSARPRPPLAPLARPLALPAPTFLPDARPAVHGVASAFFGAVHHVTAPLTP